MIRRGRGVGVVAIVAAFVMAGCSSDPEPVVTPTPTPTDTVDAVESSSPTPTPSPSATALTDEEILAAIPENLQFEAYENAVWFSQFFLDLYPGLFSETSDTALFAALSEPGCSFCSSALESSEATLLAGAHSEGGVFAWTNDPFGDARGGLRDDGFWYVVQPFTVTAIETYSADGAVLSSEPAGSGEVGVKLELNGPLWTVHGVEFDYDDA